MITNLNSTITILLKTCKLRGVTLYKLLGYARHALDVDVDDDAVQLKYVPLDFINFHVCSTLLPLIRLGDAIEKFLIGIYTRENKYEGYSRACSTVIYPLHN